MIALELLTAANAGLLKEMRLRALLDTPNAFSSTYAEESAFTDADWTTRAAKWSGASSATYLALDEKHLCGIAGGYFDDNDSTLAHLASMWVAPTHRRLGIGRRLVDAVIGWARAHDARTLALLVTSDNRAAIAFYQCLGFTSTRSAGLYRNDPALTNLEMSRSLVDE